VTVGEALTEARAQAGLSVDELSERTRIRGTVIRSIEEDDYAACGGDLYVRGYVRALAGAVGIDAQPLIREFDSGRANGADGRANGSTSLYAYGSPSVPPPSVPPPSVPPPGAPPPGAAQTAFDLPAVAEAPSGDSGPADLDATRFDLPVVSADPATTAYDLPALPEMPRTAELPAVAPPTVAQPRAAMETQFDTETRSDLAAVGYDLKPAEPAEADSATKIIPVLGTGTADPAAPHVTPEQPVPVLPGTAKAGRVRGKRRGLLALGAVVVLAAAGGVGAYLATGSTATKNTAATSVAGQGASAAAAKTSAAAKASAAAEASASAAAKASKSASAKAAAQRVISLPVASAAAFGPDGFADGDNPGNAKFAIARNAAQPWQTQWYTTSQFGMLKHGTGLLLDLGKKVTVTSVRLDLGQLRSTDMQIRAGNGTTLQDLRVAAKASGVSGVVKLTLRHPVTARYVLLWLTQLPPDGAGHYQGSVSHAVVSGRR
jgi:hypothetical protein